MSCCSDDDCKTCGKDILREGLEGVLIDALFDQPPDSDEECDAKCDAYLARALRVVESANDYGIPAGQVNAELVRQLGFADEEIDGLKAGLAEALREWAVLDDGCHESKLCCGYVRHQEGCRYAALCRLAGVES